jgi:hypothetical protein
MDRRGENGKKGIYRSLEELLGNHGFSPAITWALKFILRNPNEMMKVRCL